MTVVVGILCEDGVVVGSDSSATFGAENLRTIEQPTRKVFVIGKEIVFSATGQCGLTQRFEHLLTKLGSSPSWWKKNHIEIANSICQQAIQDFGQTQCPKGVFGALVAFANPSGFHLCEFAVSDFQPEFKTAQIWFVSMGSGQLIADPFLGMIRRVFFKSRQPKLKEGVFAVTWTLQQAIELNAGGINGPLQIATLAEESPGTRKYLAKLLTDDELAEHIDNVRGAEKHLSEYLTLSTTKAAIPPTPPPATASPPAD